MKKLSVILGLLLVMGISGYAMAADDFAPWVGIRGSYQATFEQRLFNDIVNFDGTTTKVDSESQFLVPRARIGVDGRLLEDLYFCAEFDGRYTSSGRGTLLRYAYVRWDFLKNDSMLNQLEMGAITTTFARGLSGTEYAFINYDICTVLDSYQYGVQYRGSFANKLIDVYLSVNNGTGLTSLNVGSGLQYVGRIEITPFGGDYKDLREGSTGKTVKDGGSFLTISAAAALDNKARTDDFGYTAEYYKSQHLLADITFKVGGISFFAQGVYNAYDALEDGTYWGGIDRNIEKSYGGFAQLGYNLGAFGLIELEPMVKFEYWNDVANEGFGPQDTIKQDFAVGINWYLKEHDLKLNAEFRHILKDEKVYAVKAPCDNYIGVRMTHKFGAKVPL
ncbi:MAG: OprO/OprP family phosphate-selective porin [Spirochaetota bacterium]|jgi:hypothetical protein|nr:OprO/OprP family phosphate-selective porin [Spirochaetota bacterium]